MKQMSDPLDIYHPAMDNAKYMLSRSIPLHRQIKNVCKHNISMSKELRSTKQQLRELREKDRGKLNLLAKAAKI